MTIYRKSDRKGQGEKSTGLFGSEGFSGDVFNNADANVQLAISDLMTTFESDLELDFGGRSVSFATPVVKDVPIVYAQPSVDLSLGKTSMAQKPETHRRSSLDTPASTIASTPTPALEQTSAPTSVQVPVSTYALMPASASAPVQAPAPAPARPANKALETTAPLSPIKSSTPFEPIKKADPKNAQEIAAEIKLEPITARDTAVFADNTDDIAPQLELLSQTGGALGSTRLAILPEPEIKIEPSFAQESAPSLEITLDSMLDMGQASELDIKSAPGFEVKQEREGELEADPELTSMSAFTSDLAPEVPIDDSQLRIDLRTQGQKPAEPAPYISPITEEPSSRFLSQIFEAPKSEEGNIKPLALDEPSALDNVSAQAYPSLDFRQPVDNSYKQPETHKIQKPAEGAIPKFTPVFQDEPELDLLLDPSFAAIAQKKVLAKPVLEDSKKESEPEAKPDAASKVAPASLPASVIELNSDVQVPPAQTMPTQASSMQAQAVPKQVLVQANVDKSTPPLIVAPKQPRSTLEGTTVFESSKTVATQPPFAPLSQPKPGVYPVDLSEDIFGGDVIVSDFVEEPAYAQNAVPLSPIIKEIPAEKARELLSVDVRINVEESDLDLIEPDSDWSPKHQVITFPLDRDLPKIESSAVELDTPAPSVAGVQIPDTQGDCNKYASRIFEPSETNFVNESYRNEVAAEAQARAAQLEKASAESKAAEVKAAEAARVAEEARLAEEARIAEEVRAAEAAKVAEEARLAEEARIAAELKAEQEAKAAEIARKQEAAHIAEAARVAEAAKTIAELKAKADAKLAQEIEDSARAKEEAKAAEIARKQEEAKIANAARREEAARTIEALRAAQAAREDAAARVEDAAKIAAAAREANAEKAAEIIRKQEAAKTADAARREEAAKTMAALRASHSFVEEKIDPAKGALEALAKTKSGTRVYSTAIAGAHGSLSEDFLTTDNELDIDDSDSTRNNEKTRGPKNRNILFILILFVVLILQMVIVSWFFSTGILG